MGLNKRMVEPKIVYVKEKVSKTSSSGYKMLL
jgi:hypothetical protein